MAAQIPGIQDIIKLGEPGWVKIRLVWRGESMRNYDKNSHDVRIRQNPMKIATVFLA